MNYNLLNPSFSSEFLVSPTIVNQLDNLLGQIVESTVEFRRVACDFFCEGECHHQLMQKFVDDLFEVVSTGYHRHFRRLGR